MLIHFEADYWNGNNNGFKMEYNATGKQNTPSQNNTKYHSQISASNKVLIHFQSDAHRAMWAKNFPFLYEDGPRTVMGVK